MKAFLEKIRELWAFVREAKEELKKVTWPTRDEVTSFTIVVVIAVLAISLFLWFVDSGLMYLIQLVV
ncbi:MAG: preprotein translocase subunit SecE [Spirochaetes bacterium]|nr:preprotein translocase subunit SecE [Spirochaetota bacterium]